MIRRIAAVAALATVAALLAVASPAWAACPVQPSWQPGACRAISFSDSFNGTGINHAKWEVVWTGGLAARGYSGPFNPGYETACYNSANLSESGGFARLALIHTRSQCPNGGGPQPWTGAEMDTLPTFHQAGGAFEARVCLPANSRGRLIAWPAWWQLGYRGEWPSNGEIDTIEALNDSFAGQASAHLHYAGRGDNGPGWDSPSATWGGCHRYGENWSATLHRVTFYWDGRWRWAHSFPAATPEALMLDITLAPDSIQPAGTTVMRVDWARVWR